MEVSRVAVCRKRATDMVIRENRGMQQLYESFLCAPTAAGYLSLRDQLAQHNYPQDPLALESFARLVISGRFDDAVRRRDELSHQWLLCPRFHYVSGRLAIESDDPEQAELSRFESHSCLSGLLATGNGSIHSPFQATYLTDAEDIANWLGVTIGARHCVDRDGNLFELLTCSDGQELWLATHRKTPTWHTTPSA